MGAANHLDDLDVAAAAESLEGGGVIVYPTETLYGLGADASSEPALRELAALKGRDAGKPISVLVASRAMLDAVAADVPETAEPLMAAFWPGALTIVFRARPEVSPILTGGGGTIGARVSSHPVATALVRGLGRPVTATSANPGGEPPALDVARAREYFGSRVGAYVDRGRMSEPVASTVVDFSRERPVILRDGAIPARDIERVLGHAVGRT